MNSEGVTQTVRDLPRVWQGLDRTRQLALGGVVGAILVALIAAAFYFQRPQDVLLYTSLNDQDASAIVAKLKELKVPYTLTDGGSTVRVPRNAADDLRLQLASAGLPSGTGVGVVGMEVFDRSNLGITDFAQRLNYQRGLEGELTRTITRLSAVESARVHLVLPQERLFTTQQRDTTASVVVQLRPGARISDDQVSNIRFLVSRAVEGLKPENVAVVDVQGNALGKLDTSQVARDEQAANRLQIQRQRETEIEGKIQGMLNQVLGPNKAVVRANVALDWNEVTQNIETFTPGQLLSEKDRREQFTGAGAQVPAPGGVPGTQANIPTFQNVPGGAGDSTFTSSDQTRNFQPGRDQQNIVRAPGDVKTIGIAVMVDQSVQAAQVDQITQVVTAAAGIQPQRGDQVSVVTLPFDNSLNQQLQQQQEEKKLMDYVSLGFRLAGIAVGFIGLFFLYRMMTNAVRPRPQLVALPEPAALPGGSVGLLPAATVQRQLEEVVQAGRSRAEMEAELREQLRDQVQTEVSAELRAEYEERVQARLREIEDEQNARQREVEMAEAARQREAQIEAAKTEASRREQMRDAVTKLASSKPETLAEVLNQWLEKDRVANQPPPRRSTVAIN